MNSQSPPTNVIRTDRFGSTNKSESAQSSTQQEPTEELDPQQQALFLRLQHASAEINTAIREGFYVHMLPPDIRVLDVEMNADRTEIIGMVFDYKLNYMMQQADAKRVITVDHRDALSKQRNPDYQPPRGVS